MARNGTLLVSLEVESGLERGVELCTYCSIHVHNSTTRANPDYVSGLLSSNICKSSPHMFITNSFYFKYRRESNKSVLNQLQY